MMKTNASALIVSPTNAVTHAATNDIRDIKAPVAIPWGWAWAGWLVGAAAVLALVWWAWKRWRKKKDAPKPEVVIPPHERARQRLDAALRLIDEPKPFCIAVSDALREYLEERFGLAAPERTTEEFLAELQAAEQLSVTQKESLAAFLEHCDLVKFARAEPTQTSLRELHAAAVKLVSETEPPPVSPVETTPGTDQVPVSR